MFKTTSAILVISLLTANFLLAQNLPKDCLGLSSLAAVKGEPSGSFGFDLLPDFNPETWVEGHAALKIPDMRSAMLREQAEWRDAVMDKIVKSSATGAEKAEAFDLLLYETESRFQAVEKILQKKGGIWTVAKLRRWQSHRVEVGGGVIVYVGDAGQFLEFQPNGEVYRARCGPTAALSSLQSNPPYRNDGTPILAPNAIDADSRRRLEPRSNSNQNLPRL